MIRQTTCRVGDVEAPVHHLNTVILGAGAAGMNCAVHLHEFFAARGCKDPSDRIAVVTTGVGLGASRMSGSDKQTYYKMGTSPNVADSALEFAKTLTAGGCMHGDIALAEGESSLRGFYHLVQAGVPFPHDPEGAYIGYKTDHDPNERATSAGPKTSKFMSECLQRIAERYRIAIFDKQEAVHLLTSDQDDRRRIVGLVTLDKNRLQEPGFGLTVFLCENLVLAAGGPGALFEVSVYPLGQVGAHGLGLLAGLKFRNMTEWQFGLASTKFRWNVSGTYMQVVPRVFSTDANGGDEREFLTPYFPTMSRMATAIFLKGYQWPFDAQKVLNHGSSLIDILVTHETRALGRRVYLDFRRDPVPGAGMKPYRLEELEPEARTYLERNDATQTTPFERLRHMNPDAIAIYAENGIDLAKEPLEVNVCSQHQNGGFAVDKWWESNIPHTFVIGEMAGTHGVKRPGGSALNSGQVGGIRAAERIASVYGADVATEAKLGSGQRAQLADVLQRLSRTTRGGDMAAREAIAVIQRRSTDAAAHLRELGLAEAALAEALAQRRSLRESGLRIASPAELPVAVQAEHLLLTQIALLESIVYYLRQRGGSRGSYMVLSPDGVEIRPDLVHPKTGHPYRFIPENESLRGVITEMSLTDAEAARFVFEDVPVRSIPRRDVPFEIMWAAYREGRVFKE